jgi:hypothetical protein
MHGTRDVYFHARIYARPFHHWVMMMAAVGFIGSVKHEAAKEYV